MDKNSDFNHKKYLDEIKGHPLYLKIIKKLDFNLNTTKGSVTYNPEFISVPNNTPGFNGTTTSLNDEEIIRALLLLRLCGEYKYPMKESRIVLEKAYEAPGRPQRGVKGGRIDIILHDRKGKAFLFIECKKPQSYVADQKMISGQLFQLSKLETPRPKLLVFITIADIGSSLQEKAIVVSTDNFETYEEWDDAGKPSGNSIPIAYGAKIRRSYAFVEKETSRYIPLSISSDSRTFSSLVENLHDVLWGGGGTNSNEVFAIITRLFLCKIYDEKETKPNHEYLFQRKYCGDIAESSDDLLDRMNQLYKEAEKGYLATDESDNVAFDKTRIKPSKVAYVVSALEGISITQNEYNETGDLLGTFFEEIVSHGFTQTRGQFFTPPKLVDFMIDLCGGADYAKSIFEKNPDGRGIHRLPYVIDPSCGVGTFLIRYMQYITKGIGTNSYRCSLNKRTMEAHSTLFPDNARNAWAQKCLYAIENNNDLGLAAKVNMILHGDGSMNTWIASGLLPFYKYKITDRPGSFLEKTTSDLKMNEQFDLVLSNPPFSIKLSDDDKREIQDAFSGEIGLSEDLFIERWYQLLKPKTGKFCCVLPESVCDTSTERKIRLYLLLRFKVVAVISLPYLAFKPYTSVKTCIVYAEKRPEEQTKALISAVKSVGAESERNNAKLKNILHEYGILDEEVFFAEPECIGYKRRKGLSDLVQDNDLPQILCNFKFNEFDESLRFGFKSTIDDIINRSTLRFDPKYRWLWDKLKGKVGVGEYTFPLSNFFDFYKLKTVKKGDLDEETQLIELECVSPDSLALNDNVELVDSIDSDKVYFCNADIIMPKLRTYLCKALPHPPQDAIGSSEWFGIRCKIPGHNTEFAAFLNSNLMQEVYCYLQNGKQHPRIPYEELKDLHITIDLSNIQFDKILDDVNKRSSLKKQISDYTNDIFGLIRGASVSESIKLNNVFCEVELEPYKKGELSEERYLLDLESAESGTTFYDTELQQVSEIMSDRIGFSGADLIFSKLEAYLGKVIPAPPKDAIGTKEWVGLHCLNGINPIVGAYVLIMPELLSTYRMLQSGKRHARIDISELLELEIPFNTQHLNQNQIIEVRARIERIRKKIDEINKIINEFDY